MEKTVVSFIRMKDFPTLNTQTAVSSATLVAMYKATQHHIPEDRILVLTAE
jgi:hypothetical protein